MELSDIRLYRMTHIDNIPHILLHGITHNSSPDRNPGFVPIGDSSLINTRNKKNIRIDNGETGIPAGAIIKLGNFIPFYFGVRMPMLYVIQNGGNFVKRATPAKDIIYLACSLSEILKLKFECFFSDGHATDNLTSFFDSDRMQDLPDIIDWNAVKQSYWSGNDNLNLKRKKQAEFLVSKDLPVHTIAIFGCYNEDAKKKLIDMGINEKKIKLVPGAYY